MRRSGRLTCLRRRSLPPRLPRITAVIMIAAFAVDVAVFFVADRISFQDDDNKEDGKNGGSKKELASKESIEKPVSNGASPAAALQVKDRDSSV